MREIDPIRNPSETLLSAALHRLASGSTQGAPVEVGSRLAHAFRHHHRRRQQLRVAAITAMAACLALAALLALRKTAATVAHAPRPAVLPTPGSPATPQNTPAQVQPPQASRGRPPASPSPINESSFMALDTYDPATAPSELAVVRLELSGADLRLMGAPVAEDLSDRRLLADIVVGNDGTPYAVRLVH